MYIFDLLAISATLEIRITRTLFFQIRRLTYLYLFYSSGRKQNWNTCCTRALFFSKNTGVFSRILF